MQDLATRGKHNVRKVHETGLPEKILKKEPTSVGFRTSSYTKQLASVRRSLSPTTNLRTEVFF